MKWDVIAHDLTLWKEARFILEADSEQEVLDLFYQKHDPQTFFVATVQTPLCSSLDGDDCEGELGVWDVRGRKLIQCQHHGEAHQQAMESLDWSQVEA